MGLPPIDIELRTSGGAGFEAPRIVIPGNGLLPEAPAPFLPTAVAPATVDVPVPAAAVPLLSAAPLPFPLTDTSGEPERSPPGPIANRARASPCGITAGISAGAGSGLKASKGSPFFASAAAV